MVGRASTPFSMEMSSASTVLIYSTVQCSAVQCSAEQEEVVRVDRLEEKEGSYI